MGPVWQAQGYGWGVGAATRDSGGAVGLRVGIGVVGRLEQGAGDRTRETWRRCRQKGGRVRWQPLARVGYALSRASGLLVSLAVSG